VSNPNAVSNLTVVLSPSLVSKNAMKFPNPAAV
jgi:hypothetical protein